MPRFRLTLTILAAALSLTGVRAAELEIPPPGKPRELSVYVNQPNCTRWTDECVNCTRGDGGKAPVCSNIGIACQPEAIRCLGADSPPGDTQQPKAPEKQ